MAKYKYQIGNKVKFIYQNEDEGKLGAVVGIEVATWCDGIRYLVLIPTTSSYHSGTTKDGVEYTWRCLESQIERVAQRGEQLLFDFMLE